MTTVNIWKAIYAMALFLIILVVGFSILNGDAKTIEQWEQEAKEQCTAQGGDWVVVGTYPDGRHGLANRWECQK